MQYNQPFGIADPNAAYINGDPSIGQAGSIPPAASIEYDQREIVNAILNAGLAVPTNADLAQLSKAMQFMRAQVLQDTGSVNAMLVTPNPGAAAAGTAWIANMWFVVIPNFTNTSVDITLAVANFAGTKNVKRRDGQKPAVGDLRAGTAYLCQYDGTNVRIISWLPSEHFLSANLDLYVNASTGNDSNAGTLAAPFATIQRAIVEYGRFNLNNFNVTVHVEDGTYNGPFQVGPTHGFGVINFVGDTVTPTNCVTQGNNASVWHVFAGAKTPVRIDGFRITSTGTAGATDHCDGVWADLGSVVTVARCNLHATVGHHVAAQGGAQVFLAGACTVSGGVGTFNGHMFAKDGGSRIMSSPTEPFQMTITAAVNTFYWAYAVMIGAIEVTYNAIAGQANVTGQRYAAIGCAVINSAGGGANYYPGTTAGATANGGEYI